MLSAPLVNQRVYKGNLIESFMVEGTVKFFNRTNHYGFITGDDNKSYFVHQSGLKEGVSIDENDRVSFKATVGEKGPKAEEVEKLDGKSSAKAKETEEDSDDEVADEDEDSEDAEDEEVVEA